MFLLLTLTQVFSSVFRQTFRNSCLKEHPGRLLQYYKDSVNLSGKNVQKKFKVDDVFIILTLTDFTHCSGLSIVDFEQVNTGWGND